MNDQAWDGPKDPRIFFFISLFNGFLPTVLELYLIFICAIKVDSSFCHNRSSIYVFVSAERLVLCFVLEALLVAVPCLCFHVVLSGGFCVHGWSHLLLRLCKSDSLEHVLALWSVS